MKPSRGSFLDEKQSRRLGVEVWDSTRRPRGRGQVCPPPSWAPRSSTNVLLLLYILLYPRNIRGSHKTTFTPLQPSIPVRSHLGAFSSDLPEGESITVGFYINTMASPMKHEQFTTDFWVHIYQLDGIFSLFDSQYKVLLDVLGDLFDAILFCGVLAELR